MFQKGKTYEEIYTSNPYIYYEISFRSMPDDFILFIMDKMRIPKISKLATCSGFCELMDSETKLLFNSLSIEIIEIKQDIKLKKFIKF
jgi:hypothetical protein